MARPKQEAKPIVKTGERSGRPNRVPINGERNKFKIEPQEPGYHYFVANEDQVLDYVDAGYEFVTHACRVGSKMMNQSSGMTDSKISFPVGNGQTGYVMRCTNEIYEEELHAMAKKADDLEQMTKESLTSKADGRYGKLETFKDKKIDPTQAPD